VHDEIVVSTLPASASHWMRIDGPVRLGRATDAIVHHVVAREADTEPRSVHVDRRPGPGVLAPLVALGYGRPRTGD
jgi:hypothetical protein